MKKILLLVSFLGVLLFYSFETQGQNLTWEMRNPRIFRGGAPVRTRLQYDVFVKASTTGCYFYANQIAFQVASTANYGTTAADLVIDLTGGILAPISANLLTPTKGWNIPTRTFGFGLVLDGTTWNGTDYASCSVEFPTTMTKLCTIGVTITTPTGIANAAGLLFYDASMPGGVGGLQEYGLAAELVPTYHDYGANSFSGQQFSDLYLARVFSGAWGWSEANFVTAGQSAPVWTNVYNTSVWDTSTTAAQITGLNSLCSALRVHTYGALIINPTASLTASGNTEIQCPRGLRVNATSAGYGQFIDNGTVTYINGGTAMPYAYFTQETLPNYGWHGWASPVSSFNSYAAFYWKYLQYYTESTHAWTQVTTGQTFSTKMQGFTVCSTLGGVYGSATPYSSFEGTLNTGSITSPGITRVGGTDGWNLIGNPYVSAVDLGPVTGSIGPGWTWASADIDPSVYITKPTTGTAGGRVWMTYNWSTGASTNGGSRYIGPQQGFWVHHSLADQLSKTISINNSARVINSVGFVKDEIASLLRINATDLQTSNSDEVLVAFNDNTTLGYDGEYDVLKGMNGAGLPDLYFPIVGTDETNKLAQNWVPFTGINQVVPLNFTCEANGDFNINASNIESFPVGTVIYLEDISRNYWQNLNDNPTFRLTFTAGNGDKHFNLHFTYPFMGVDNKNIEQFQIYSFEQNFYVKNVLGGDTKGKVELVDMTGRTVYRATLDNTLINKFWPNVVEAYYVVRVITDAKVYTQKVYIQ
jgi:hypothetical protein